MPLHINLCIDLQFIYFIDFVFMLTLFGVQPARQLLCVPGGEEMFQRAVLRQTNNNRQHQHFHTNTISPNNNYWRQHFDNKNTITSTITSLILIYTGRERRRRGLSQTFCLWETLCLFALLLSRLHRLLHLSDRRRVLYIDQRTTMFSTSFSFTRMTWSICRRTDVKKPKDEFDY